MKNPEPEASGPIIYGLALSTPAAVVSHLAVTLTRYRRRIGTRWRGYDTTTQAILTCMGRIFTSGARPWNATPSRCRAAMRLAGVDHRDRDAGPGAERPDPLRRKQRLVPWSIPDDASRIGRVGA